MLSLSPLSTSALHKQSYLAPYSESLFFRLNEQQKERAQNLIQTLEKVLAYLEEEERGYIALDWVDEESPLQYRDKFGKKSAQEGLIPRMQFYQLLGIKNIEALKEMLETALQEKGMLPKKWTLSLDPAIGLYRFLRLTHSLSESETIFGALQLKSFHRNNPHLNKPFLSLTSGAIHYQLADFILHGEEAQQATAALFSNSLAKEKQLKVNLLKRTDVATDLIKTMDQLKGSIKPGNWKGNDKQKREVILAAEKYAESFVPFRLRQRAFQENLYSLNGSQLQEWLTQTAQHILENEIVLSEKGGEINYINLPALTEHPESSDIVLSGISEAELQLTELLQIAMRPEQEIIKEIAFRLSSKEKPVAGKYEADLSRLIPSFSADLFQNEFVFYSLLKILSATSTFTPLLESNNDTNDYGLILRKNILVALQTKRPLWFTHALTLLNEEGDAYELIVSFLAATGWIDTNAQFILQKNVAKDRDEIEKIKKLLSKSIVVTSATIEAEEHFLEEFEYLQHGRGWESTQRIDMPLDKLRVYTFIKAKIFLSKHPVDNTATALAFLSSEEFMDVAKEATTIAALPNVLSEVLSRKQATRQIKGFYQWAFYQHNDSFRAAILFFEAAVNHIIDLGPYDNLDILNRRFQGLLQRMRRFISASSLQDFLRQLFYFRIQERVMETISNYFFEQLLTHLNNQLETNTIRFPQLERALENIATTYTTAEQALEDAQDNTGAITEIEHVMSPIRFAKEESDFFSEGSANKTASENKATKIVRLRLSLAYIFVKEKIKQELQQQFEQGVPILQIWEEAPQRLAQAKKLFLEEFSQQKYLLEIRRQLRLETVVKEKTLISDKANRLPIPSGNEEQKEQFLCLLRKLKEGGAMKNVPALEQLILTPIPAAELLKTKLLSTHALPLSKLLIASEEPYMDESL